MIKWLLVGAFLANLLVFYWFSSQSARNVESKTAWDEPSAEIVLLSELKVIPPERSLFVAEVVLTEELGVVAEASVAPSAGEYAVQEPLSSKGSSLLQGDQSGFKAEPDQKGLINGLALADESRVEPKIEPEIEPEIEPKSVASRLKLDKEQPCVLLGRFDSERDATDLMEKLEREGGVTAKLKKVIEGFDRYLVYMPPFETKAKAKLQQSVLKKAGIRSSLYYKGALKNGLSLGFFGSKNNAARRYDSLLAAGYDVELKTMVTKMSRYWLELERHELAKLSQLFWQDLAKEFPNVLSKPAECVLSGKLDKEERAE